MTGVPPKVFISYSHDTVAHQERVLDLADRLRADGIDAEVDQYNDSPPEGWPLWCEQQIDTVDFVLMVCTETYHRRVRGEEQPGTGLGVVWEAAIIRQLLYDTGVVGTRFVPILFSDASPEQIPKPIKGWTHYVVDTEDGYQTLYRRLTEQPRHVRGILGKIRPLPPRRRQWPEGSMEVASSAPAYETDRMGAGNHKRLVCSKITACDWLQADHLYNPYRSLPDPTDAEFPQDDLKIHAFLWLPGVEYLKGTLQPFTPAVAICTPEPDGVLENMNRLLIPEQLIKLDLPPGKVRNEDREALITSIGNSLENSFVVLVSIPRLVLGVGRSNRSIAYNAILDIFLLPLLEMHRPPLVKEFHIHLSDIGGGENDTLVGPCKKLSKAVFSRGTYSVGFINDVPHWRKFARIGRFCAWAVGSYHNSHNERWVAILENALSK